MKRLGDLPAAKATVLDVTPRQLLELAGDRLSGHNRRALSRYRYGPGVCKVDWALCGPVPWTAERCREAVTLHIGGTFEEIARSEEDVAHGRHADRPFCLVTQPCLVDPTRAPAGNHTLWAYCHVPNGSDVDMTERIEAQIERFAPGFRDLVIGRSSFTAVATEAHNPSYVGGDINAGAASLRQMVLRPTARWNPYRTALDGVYLCSAATPPGGGRARHVRAGGGTGGPARPAPARGSRTVVNRARPLAYAWYRLRATIRAERLHLLLVALLIGGMGGLSLAAVAAARTTQSSYTDYVTALHVPQLFVIDGVINPSIGLDSAYNPDLLRTLSHLPYVQRVSSEVELNAGPLSPSGQPLPTESISAEASVNGLGYTADPVSIEEGRLPNPPRAGRVRPRCGGRQGAGLPPGTGGPHRMGLQRANFIRKHRRRGGAVGPARQAEVGRPRRSGTDFPLRGPG